MWSPSRSIREGPDQRRARRPASQAPSGLALLMASVLALCTLGQIACRERRQSDNAPRFQGQSLRVSTFPGYLLPTVTNSFNEQTGARVSVESYASNEDLIKRIEGGGSYDVIFPSSYAVERLILRDRLRPMERELVPNLLQVPERFRNPPSDPSLRHCVPYTWSLTGLGVVSNRALPGRDPDTLAALFAEQGPRVLLMDDMRATFGVALRSLGLSASTRRPEEIIRARDLLLRLAPRIAGFPADVGPPLHQRQATLALGWSGDVMEAAQRDPQLRFVIPREGVVLFIDYACVPRTASNPALAFAFLNHLLDPQIAAQVANIGFFVAPNSGAFRLLRPEARWLMGSLDTLLANGRFEIPRDVGSALALYEESWRAVKAAAH